MLSRAFAVTAAFVVMIGITSSSFGQDKTATEDKKIKLNRAEQAQYQALHTLVDDVIAGKQPAPADLQIKFQNHFVRATDGTVIPYMLEVSGGKFSSFPVGMYVRAIAKGQATPAPATPAPSNTEGTETPQAPTYAFEDISFLESRNFVSQGQNVTAVSRALELAPGDYDVYFALEETAPRNGGKNTQIKRVVHVQPLTVPNLSTGLASSTIILGKEMEPEPKQLTPQQQLEQPFTLGGYRITPTFTASFPKSGELLFLFFVYNEGVAATGKPDVSVDYLLFKASQPNPLGRLESQSFDATTLPAEFNVADGHQVVVGQGIPLASLDAGDYRLEIKITDKTNSQSLVRNIAFTVTP